MTDKAQMTRTSEANMPPKADTATELAEDLAVALERLFSLATDRRVQLPKHELYTDMALSGARQALAKARAAGLLRQSDDAE